MKQEPIMKEVLNDLAEAIKSVLEITCDLEKRVHSLEMRTTNENTKLNN